MEHIEDHNLESQTSSASAEDRQAETAPQPATAGVQDEQSQPSTCVEDASPPVFTRHQLRMLSELDPSALGLPNQPDGEESDSASDEMDDEEYFRSQTWFRRRPSHEIEALFLRRGYIRLSDMYAEHTNELTDDLESIRLDVALNCMRDIAEPSTGDGLFDPTVHRRLSHLDQPLDLRAQPPDAEAHRRVGDVAAKLGGDVDFDQVALVQST